MAAGKCVQEVFRTILGTLLHRNLYAIGGIQLKTTGIYFFRVGNQCAECEKQQQQQQYIHGERLFAVHRLSERTTVQTSSLLLRLLFFYLLANPTQPDPYR